MSDFIVTVTLFGFNICKPGQSTGSQCVSLCWQREREPPAKERSRLQRCQHAREGGSWSDNNTTEPQKYIRQAVHREARNVGKHASRVKVSIQEERN